MAGNRVTRTLIPTTSCTEVIPAHFDFQGPKKRRRISRVTTSDGTDFTSQLERVLKESKIVFKQPGTHPSTKSPPLPPIPRPEPTAVDSKVRTEIERRQFQPLTDDWFWRMISETYKVDEFEWTKWAVDLDRMKVLRFDFRWIMKETLLAARRGTGEWAAGEMGHVAPTLVDLYIYLVCEYRNRAIARTLEGGDLAGDSPTKQKISCIVIDTQRIFWDLNKGIREHPIDPKTGRKDRTKAPQWRYQNFARAWALIQEALAQYDDETFKNLDYVFMPFEYQSYHTTLLGLAPKQRFCFNIDNSSIVVPRPEASKEPSWGLYHDIFSMHLLEAIIFERFGEALDTTSFPLYGQWAYRSSNPPDRRTTDNSPDAPRQNDSCNCGMWTMTMAFNLAFGYDMLCGRGQDLYSAPPRVGKRMRVAAEFLNGGFDKPFDYPLFKIPKKLREIVMDKSFAHNLQPPPPSPDPSDSEDEDEEEESEDADESSAESESQTGDEEQEGAQAGARTKVKKVKKVNHKKIKWSGQNATDPEPIPPETSPTGSTADEGPTRTLWPAQMDPTRTGQCGFIYPIKNPRFPRLRYRTREELKRAAHLNQMFGWQWWKDMPMHLFRAWMENTMAGREDEELTPWIDVIDFQPPNPPQSTTSQAGPST